jgi:adenylate kinase
MNIIVFGAQGTGKSTYAKYIAEKLNVPYIYSGDLFRQMSQQASTLGQQIKEYVTKGLLVPDDIVISAVKEELNKIDLSRGVVFDGFPRNLKQAQSLPVEVALIIHITLSEKIILERLLKRGRSDDTMETIRKRLEIYDKETAPLLKFYGEKGVKMIEIDNTLPVEIVKKQIDDLLKE